MRKANTKLRDNYKTVSEYVRSNPGTALSAAAKTLGIPMSNYFYVLNKQEPKIRRAVTKPAFAFASETAIAKTTQDYITVLVVPTSRIQSVLNEVWR